VTIDAVTYYSFYQIGTVLHSFNFFLTDPDKIKGLTHIAPVKEMRIRPDFNFLLKRFYFSSTGNFPLYHFCHPPLSAYTLLYPFSISFCANLALVPSFGQAQ